MAAIAKSVYFDKLNNTVLSFNSTVVNSKNNTKSRNFWWLQWYTFVVNKRRPNYKFYDLARMSKCKNIFGKNCFLNWIDTVYVS